MGFDIENFGLGLLAGWGSALGVYLARRQIGSAVGMVRQQVQGAQQYATSSADNRYTGELLRLCETTHLAGMVVPLSSVLVEPRFLAAPELAAPPDDDHVPSVFEVIPRVPDHPYLLAPYNVESLSIEELTAGGQRLALLGQPGSGRTTALLAIALWGLGKLQVEQPQDVIQQRLDKEEAVLSDKERAARIKERMLIEERAKERLAEQQAESGEILPQESRAKSRRLIPIYVHLANINPESGEYGTAVDPAEPLVRAVQHQVGTVTARAVARHLYQWLNTGQAMVLIDGYDDLPEPLRRVRLAWLRAFLSEYDHNFIIVTGPASGFGALQRLGLTPVYLRPWTEADNELLIQKWAEAWAQITGTRRRPGAKPDDSVIARAKVRTLALSPLDLTLKIWSAYANDVDAPGFEGWLRAYVARHLPSDTSLGVLLPQLSQLGTLQLEKGLFAAQDLEGLLGGHAAPPPTPEADATDEAAEPEKEETSVQGKLLAALRRTGLLVQYRGGRYQFRHAFIAAYLASLMLKDVAPEHFLEYAAQPQWAQAVAYAAAHMPVDAAVNARLDAAGDILQNTLLDLARWLAYADTSVAWRATLIKQLGTLLLAPTQYPLVRERAAAALITTRDTGAAAVFRRAVRSLDAQVRQLGALGCGAMKIEEAVNDLVPLLHDADAGVQIAAGLALGAIGTDPALDHMVEALMNGGEQVQRAVAETFAALPQEGYPILYDAISHEEMSVRRAAVFGLRRLKTPWALIAIYRAFLEDPQWYVRSAAQQAFTEMHSFEHGGPLAYPPAKAIPWLLDWASRHGEGLPSVEVANQMLLKALQEGEPDEKMLSAATLGQLGLADMAKPLYTALCDRHAPLRDTAYRALGELQLQMGRAIPVPA